MKTFTLLFTLVLMGSASPQYGHKFFGIDLDADWYTLTNHSWITYYNMEMKGDGKFVVTDFEYSKSKIDQKFATLDFDELLLCFPIGKKSDLETTSPEMFIGRIGYNSPIEYEIQSKDDMAQLKKLFKQEFGEPELNMDKEDVTIYKWESVKNTLILTCRLDELNTAVYYMKNVN